MRALAVLALAAALAAVLVHTAVAGRGHRVAVALLLLVLTPLAFAEWRWRTADAVVSAATLRIAPRSEGSSCQRMLATFAYAGAEAGHVELDASGEPVGPAFLSYQACQDLGSWLRSDRRSPTSDQVVAVHVVSHEAFHLLGDASEAHAECLAVQQDARTAVALGATPAQGRALAKAYWGTVYPLMPASYRSADCREDGPWDRSPGDGAWP